MIGAFSTGPTMRPDKKIITDEVWDDERVRSFLTPQARQGADDADFTLLVNAYRAMRIDDFVRFIAFFVHSKHRLDAQNEIGQTFVEFIARHRHGKPFVEAAIAAGARPARDGSS
jgi:hypothetical protein